MLAIAKEMLMTKLPPSGAGRLADDYPAVREYYLALGKAVSEAGDWDARTRRLLKVAMAIGAASEGAVHSHVRQAKEEGLSRRRDSAGGFAGDHHARFSDSDGGLFLG